MAIKLQWERSLPGLYYAKAPGRLTCQIKSNWRGGYDASIYRENTPARPIMQRKLPRISDAKAWCAENVTPASRVVFSVLASKQQAVLCVWLLPPLWGLVLLGGIALYNSLGAS